MGGGGRGGPAPAHSSDEEGARQTLGKVNHPSPRMHSLSPKNQRGNYPNEEFFVRRTEGKVEGMVLRKEEEGMKEGEATTLRQGFHLHDFYSLCRGEVRKCGSIFSNFTESSLLHGPSKPPLLPLCQRRPPPAAGPPQGGGGVQVRGLGGDPGGQGSAHPHVPRDPHRGGDGLHEEQRHGRLGGCHCTGQ